MLDAISEGKVEFAISTALVFEYEDVLKRPDAKLVFSDSEIDEVLDSIISLGVRYSPHFLWRPYLKDPKDDMVLELAVVSGAKRIITHDIKDFKNTLHLGVKAITPLEYVRKEKIL